MGKLRDRLNARNAECKALSKRSLEQKIEYIRLQGIAEDLKLERELKQEENHG